MKILTRLNGMIPSLMVLAACGGDDGGSNPSIGIDVTPGSINVEVGGSGSATATITRAGGYNVAVGLTTSGAPAGMTVAFNPGSVPAGITTSTVEVAVASTVAPGTYAVTVTVSGPDVADATDQLTVVVITTAAGGFSLSPSSTSLAAPVGGAAVTSTITIGRAAPFAGPVALTVTGAPSGMTATLNPTSATGTSSTLSVQAGSTTATGTYSLTVRGTGTGVADVTTVISVTVTGGGGTFTVTVTFCNADVPIWAARQDGDGAWAQVPATGSGNTFQFGFTQGRGAIALVDTVGAGTQLRVIYGTTADFGNLATALRTGGCRVKTLSGAVAGVGPTDIATVTVAFSTAFVTGAVSTAYQLTGVADGPQDLLAARASIATGTPVTTRIIMRPVIDLANNALIPLLDFNNAAEALDPVTANVTVTGMGMADTVSVQSVFNGMSGSAFGIISVLQDYLATSGPQPYYALPVRQLAAGEIHLLQAAGHTADVPTTSRSAAVYFRSAASRTLALGPVLTTPTVTEAASAPYVRPRIQLPVQAQYGRWLDTRFSQDGLSRSVSLDATGAYFGAPATWDVTLPDFTGVTGWNNAWGLQDGTAINWAATALGGVTPFLDASITDGSSSVSATQEGAL